MNSIKDILVIDDEQVILDSVVKIAAFENLTVDTSGNGADAIEKLNSTNYRLIISDIMMPVMDGFMLLDELNLKNISTPVIITTGYSTFENAVKALYKGAIDFIPKPFTVEEISSVIHRGIKYSNIVNRQSDVDNSGGLISYVPGPPKYFRLGYSSWAYQAGSKTVVTGLTDLFNKTIDTVKKIELIEPGEHVSQANYSIKIETDQDLIHQVYSPVSGKIIARNEKLFEDFSLLEKDPYFEGWIYQIEPDDIENEIKNLISCCSDRA